MMLNVLSAPKAKANEDNATTNAEGTSTIVSNEGVFTEKSDLSRTDRRIWVVTTAALPWRTGTAVNPLLRALYLARDRPPQYVTLLVPWVPDAKARAFLYGANLTFQNPSEQEAWIRNFCVTRAGMSDPGVVDKLRIQFWEGVYHHSFGSIFPVVDICAQIPSEEADIAILEEPEHLNWFRVPDASVANDEAQELGWAHKFQHVVGILHTNYGSYMKQYGMGTSVLTAPALNALSALVIKAYCHKVIRLSGTLTSLVPSKEITCNVHGVREEFFVRDQASSSPTNLGLRFTTTLSEPANTPPQEKCAAVYFIGKLIWAKGFEYMLELQERYRAQNGEYFAVDIYGVGNDEKAIRRAFFGRSKRQDSDDSSQEEEDKLAADIFDQDESLRSWLREREAQRQAERQSAQRQADNENVVDEVTRRRIGCGVPLDVITDLSKRTLGTGVETAGAALKLVEHAMNHGFGAFSKEDKKNKPRKNKSPPRPFSLGPSLAVYKWRRQPVPARFLGVKDHIEIRDLPQYVFLNMSTSEVLCTTSAEALAMGKFAILPKHPSNDFFYQFSNCLPYEDLDECLEKLQYALANKPKPLSSEEAYKLAWDGATERLYEASRITEEQEKEDEEECRKAAQFHVQTARKSHYVSSLLSGNILRPNRASPAP